MSAQVAQSEALVPTRAQAQKTKKAGSKRQRDDDGDDVSVSSVGTDEFATNKELVKLQTATQNQISKMHKRGKGKPEVRIFPTVCTLISVVVVAHTLRLQAGVLYVGRIPHGFYETQMRAFFSQFGVVEHVRVSRNKKTGKSKHYAFIQFEDQEVAHIVAEAMNNQIVLGSLLQCEVLPPERVHKSMFVGADVPFKKIDFQGLAREAHNQPRSPSAAARRCKTLVKSENKKRAKLAELGVNYEFAGYVSAFSALVSITRSRWLLTQLRQADQRIAAKEHKRFN